MARIPCHPSLVILATLLLFAAGASAQSPGIIGDPYGGAGSLMSVPSPYWGYSSDPYSGYLFGAAAVIRAQAEFMVSREQAALTREMVRSAKIDNRKKEIEHWAWEREFVFTAVTAERDRIRQYEIEQSRKDPPLTHILSARALNDLLEELKKMPDLPPVAAVAVDPAWLPHIHFSGGEAGNVGLLKNDTLSWPMLLRRQDFNADREQFERRLAQVKQRLALGKIDVEDYIELKQCLVAMDRKLTTALKEAGLSDPIWTPHTFVTARRYLRELNDVVVVLEEPQAAYYLNPLRGANVAELVGNMRSNGLKFAPATRGTERYYTALHRALSEALTRTRQ